MKALWWTSYGTVRNNIFLSKTIMLISFINYRTTFQGSMSVAEISEQLNLTCIKDHGWHIQVFTCTFWFSPVTVWKYPVLLSAIKSFTFFFFGACLFVFCYFGKPVWGAHGMVAVSSSLPSRFFPYLRWMTHLSLLVCPWAPNWIISLFSGGFFVIKQLWEFITIYQ